MNERPTIESMYSSLKQQARAHGVPSIVAGLALLLGCSMPLDGTWEDRDGTVIEFDGATMSLGDDDYPYKVVDAEPRQLHAKFGDEWRGFAAFKVTPTTLTICFAKIYQRTYGGFPMGVSRGRQRPPGPPAASPWRNRG